MTLAEKIDVVRAGGPPVCQGISVVLPSPVKDQSRILTKILQHPELTTNGITLVRVDQKVVYDVEFLRFNPEWIEGLIGLSNQSLPPKVIKQIRRVAQFYQASAPNLAVAQQTNSQLDLAVQFVQMLQPLVRALEAPVVLLRQSGAVVTEEIIKQVGEAPTGENLISFYIKLVNSGESLYTVGMHQFGYAEVEIPFSLLAFDQAFELISEFRLHQIDDGLFAPEKNQLNYQSRSGSFLVQRKAAERFAATGDSRFNRFGVWHFTDRL